MAAARAVDGGGTAATVVEAAGSTLVGLAGVEVTGELVGTVVAGEAAATVSSAAVVSAGAEVSVATDVDVDVIVSPRFVTACAPSSRLWAISFGFSSAVARLAKANIETAAIAAATPAITRRGAGSRWAFSRRHQAVTRPVRIGVSINR